MSSGDGFDDLDLEQIARDALAELNVDSVEGLSDEATSEREASGREPLSEADTAVNLRKVAEAALQNVDDVFSIANVFAAEEDQADPISQLQRAAEALANDAKRKGQDVKADRERSQKRALPLTDAKPEKAPVSSSAAREVTRICKIAPSSMTAEATSAALDSSVVKVGRSMARASQVEKTVVFKADGEDKISRQMRAIRLDGKQPSGKSQVGSHRERGDSSRSRPKAALPLPGGNTERGIPFSELPMTVTSDFSTVGLKPSLPVQLGTVVVEAPNGAEVYVNGLLRGHGRVMVENLDRYTPFWIRIHLADHDPWSAEVSLRGQRAAKVQPEMY